MITLCGSSCFGFVRLNSDVVRRPSQNTYNARYRDTENVFRVYRRPPGVRFRVFAEIDLTFVKIWWHFVGAWPVSIHIPDDGPSAGAIDGLLIICIYICIRAHLSVSVCTKTSSRKSFGNAPPLGKRREDVTTARCRGSYVRLAGSHRKRFAGARVRTVRFASSPFSRVLKQT